jgi:hypothetical protein
MTVKRIRWNNSIVGEAADCAGVVLGTVEVPKNEE